VQEEDAGGGTERELKEKGNAAFKVGDFEAAEKWFSLLGATNVPDAAMAAWAAKEEKQRVETEGELMAYVLRESVQSSEVKLVERGGVALLGEARTKPRRSLTFQEGGVNAEGECAGGRECLTTTAEIAFRLEQVGGTWAVAVQPNDKAKLDGVCMTRPVSTNIFAVSSVLSSSLVRASFSACVPVSLDVCLPVSHSLVCILCPKEGVLTLS